MKTTCSYLDAVQSKLNLHSDNAIAKSLGISRQAVSNYRAGRASFEDSVARRAAEILDIHPGIVLLDMYAERTKNTETRSLWEEIAEGFLTLLPHANKGRRHPLPL